MYIYKLLKSEIMKIRFHKPCAGIVILLLVSSCKISPQKIEYGKDQCSFCIMNIVDKTHAAQYVTKKGKQFKFDSIECLINDLSDKNEEDLAILLVSDYGNPGKMIPAKTAAYLISKEIKSPMGANLSALSAYGEAQELQRDHTGEIYAWDTLKQKLSDK